VIVRNVDVGRVEVCMMCVFDNEDREYGDESEDVDIGCFLGRWSVWLVLFHRRKGRVWTHTRYYCL
jgi:hypothetical protein